MTYSRQPGRSFMQDPRLRGTLRKMLKQKASVPSPARPPVKPRQPPGIDLAAYQQPVNAVVGNNNAQLTQNRPKPSTLPGAMWQNHIRNRSNEQAGTARPAAPAAHPWGGPKRGIAGARPIIGE